MNSSPSDLMSYCSWAKKNSGYRESIENYFYRAILYYRDFYAFSYTIRDALRGKKKRRNIIVTFKKWKKKFFDRAFFYM